jgi:hypothetical protein
MAAYLGPPAADDFTLPGSSSPPREEPDASIALDDLAIPRKRDTRTALDDDIAELNLEPVSFLAVLKERWGVEKVDSIELEYRCWLQCVRDFPDELLVPSFDCDLYWHHHILCLGLYLEQTTQLFGRALLHWPFSGALGEADAARQQARFQKSRRIVGDLLDRVRRARSTNE